MNRRETQGNTMSDEVMQMLTLPAFEQAAQKVREVTQETKLIESPYFR